ncbi:MAG: UbiD family decarboxylase [Defluviicoccus sp.]|nr:UbiD family decarboxylase [Defluviicoccus sp.]
MVGTIMDRDVEMVPCETVDLRVPAHAEIVVEGTGTSPARTRPAG